MEVWGNWQIGKLTNRQINQSIFFLLIIFAVSYTHLTLPTIYSV